MKPGRHQPEIIPVVESDGEKISKIWLERWGGDTMVVHGRLFHARELPGFWALLDGKIAGLVTYRLEPGACEVISLDSYNEGMGTGSMLLDAVEQIAQQLGCRRVYLSTTNDNIKALGWYQKRGYRLVALRAGAVDEARRVKPTIPLVGEYGIQIHDELELEKRLE